jgi:hypothetical protein
VEEYFKILARCKGSEERTARAVKVLGRMVEMGFWAGGEVSAFNFACQDGDDNVAVVRGYLEVLVGLKRAEGQKKTSKKKKGGGKKKKRGKGGGSSGQGGGGGGDGGGGGGAVDDDGVIRAEIVRNALHQACHEGHLEVARLLVEAEGGLESLKVKTDHKESPIDVATLKGHADIAAMLKDAFREHIKATLAAKHSPLNERSVCGAEQRTVGIGE